MQDFKIKTEKGEQGNVAQAISSLNQESREKEVLAKAESLRI